MANPTHPHAKNWIRTIVPWCAIFLLVWGLIAQSAGAKNPIHTFKVSPGHITSVVFSADGKLALSGSTDRTLKLWDVNTKNEIRTFSGHTGSVNSVAISKDNKYALSGSKDKTLKLWDVVTGKEIRTFVGHREAVNSVLFSPNGKYALSGSEDKTVKQWDLSKGKSIYTFTFNSHKASVKPIAFDVYTFNKHKASVKSVAFSRDGKYVLSGGGGKILMLWKLATGEIIHRFKGHESRVTSVAFSPDGKHILSGSFDNTIKLWDVATGKEIRSFEKHEKHVMSVAFSPDGRFILSGSADKTLKLWAVEIEEEFRTYEGHQEGIRSVVFSQDGKYALSGSEDNTLKLWKLFDTASPSPKASNDPGVDIPAEDLGNYHALIIGINDYEHLKDLTTPVDDAKEVDRILRKQYGFKTKLLIDKKVKRDGKDIDKAPTHDDIMNALTVVKKNLGDDDNLLIYYSGHGYFDKATGKYYWLPADAMKDDELKWIMVDLITTKIKAMSVRHVLVVVDSCFAGTFKDPNIKMETRENKRDYLVRMYRDKSRTVMTSGGNEPVAANDGSGHSAFTHAIIDALRDPGAKVFAASDWFTKKIKVRVIGNSGQKTEYDPIKASGHEGGDFIFRKNK